MRGQGSPSPGRLSRQPRARPRARQGWLVALACGVAACLGPLGASSALAAELRIRIAWGGGTPRPWVGSVGVTQGAVRQVTLLGVEADDPGSVWLDDRGSAWIQQRSPRSYSAIDVQVSAAAGSKLVIALAARDESPLRATTREVPLDQLLHTSQEGDLDGQANRLLVRRAPGDNLRLLLEPRPMIFAPGEVLRAQLQPYALPVEPGTTVQFKVALVDAATDKEVWTEKPPPERQLPADDSLLIPLVVRLPQVEGVYRLIVEASPRDLRSRIGFGRVVARRELELLVLGAQPLALTPGAVASTPDWSPVVELDPANPAWWKRLTELPVPYLRRGPLDSGDVSTISHPLGRLTQLAPQPREPDAAWAAYALPLSEPGKPHLLEIEYPGNVPQSVSLSIVEPNAAGQVVPIGIDSGFYVPDEAADRPAEWQKHRVIFWPRTKTPLALVVNRRPGAPAVYGKLRVLAGPERLPHAPGPTDVSLGVSLGRPVWAYLEKPYFPKSFSAVEEADADSQRVLDGWRTFYQGGTRLVEYLQHTGHTGLMLGVCSDGGTIYPSAVLQPNTRYDSGVFCGTARDPLPKDALEMLFRLFDRERLQLVPTVDFSSPLPALEALLRTGGLNAEGIAWVGPDGRSWLDHHSPTDGQAPYYNPLHPRVQDAMRRVIGELIARYGHHPSFAGLAVRLSSEGYAVLPGPEWGLDDVTIEQFQHDTKLVIGGEGPQRHLERARLLAGPHRAAWLVWRSARLCELYRTLQRDLAMARGTVNRPPLRLYLDAARLLDSPAAARSLRPTLPPQSTLGNVLTELGLDPAQVRGLRDVVFLQPRQIAPPLAARPGTSEWEADHASALDAQFADMPLAGGQFYHPPQTLRLASFDEASPFKDTFTRLVTQSLPSDVYNRQRFAQALAGRDLQLMVDGGRLLPLGQQDALQEWLAVYRQLPPVPFQTLSPGKTQPVTVRAAAWQGRTWWYAVNDSPWAVGLRIRAAVAEQVGLQWLGSAARARAGRDDLGAYWDLELQPFELVAAWFPLPEVQLLPPEVRVPDDVPARLERRIADLAARVNVLKTHQPSDLLANPGFEAQPSRADEIPGWITSRQPGAAARLDASIRHEGQASVHLSSGGPVASLASEPFPPPRGGRLMVLAHLKVADESRQPSLRIAVEGVLNGRSYYRPGAVGAGTEQPVRAEWTPLFVRFDDLPAEGLTQIRVRFDLMDAGEVWIDDVQVSSLYLVEDKHRSERNELLTLFQAAQVSLQEGKVSSARRLLMSYWPRLLEEVPAPARPLAAPRPEPTPAEAAKSEDPPQTGLLDRAKGWLPGWMRF